MQEHIALLVLSKVIELFAKAQATTALHNSDQRITANCKANTAA
jgi:hypothetical protein